MNILNPGYRIFSLISSILLVIFGLVALIFPSITLVALAIYFAITIFAGGVLHIISSVKMKDVSSNWTFLLLEGIIGILLGIVIMLRPEMAATVFVIIIGIWALFLGAMFLVIYFLSKIRVFGRGLLLLTGILSSLFGVIILAEPFDSTRAIVIIIGIYAIAYGIFSIINNYKKYH